MFVLYFESRIIACSQVQKESKDTLLIDFHVLLKSLVAKEIFCASEVDCTIEQVLDAEPCANMPFVRMRYCVIAGYFYR